MSPPPTGHSLWNIGASVKHLFHFSLLIFRQSVGLLGRGINPSQGRYLHTGQYKQRINIHNKHPCPRRDSNSWSQRPSERRQFMPQTARLPWQATRCLLKINFNVILTSTSPNWFPLLCTRVSVVRHELFLHNPPPPPNTRTKHEHAHYRMFSVLMQLPLSSLLLFFYSCCSHLENTASVKRFVSLQFLNLRQSVGLLGRGISTSQDSYQHRT
jgi:hypothetical protein